MSRGRRVATLLLGTLLVAATPAGAMATPDRASPPDDRTSRLVQEELERITGDPGVPGAELVASGPGEPATWTHSGTGELGVHDPIGPRERLRIGSDTKTFVASVVIQLVAEDKVDLDSPVERYLPGVLRGSGDDASAITVRQLLQHTSGIPEYTTELWSRGPGPVRYQRFQPRELVGLALRQPPLFAPGRGWSYSNTNYILAGMLVERVTGRALRAEVRDRVVEPLGLHDTNFPGGGDPSLPDPHPRGYLAEDGRLTDITELDPSQLWAAAGMISTGSDVTRFYDALIHGRVVPPAQLAEMMRTVPMDGQGNRYGLGLMRRPLSCGGGYWGHLGGIPGFSVLNGVTADGRRAALGLNGSASTADSGDAILSAVDTALCETG